MGSSWLWKKDTNDFWFASSENKLLWISFHVQDVDTGVLPLLSYRFLLATTNLEWQSSLRKPILLYIVGLGVTSPARFQESRIGRDTEQSSILKVIQEKKFGSCIQVSNDCLVQFKTTNKHLYHFSSTLMIQVSSSCVQRASVFGAQALARVSRCW